MKIIDVLILNVTREYEEFKTLELTKTYEEIFEDSEKIYFYKNIYEFFQMFEFNKKSFTERLLAQLFLKDETTSEVDIISYLWDCYLNYHDVSVSSFSQIEELIELAAF